MYGCTGDCSTCATGPLSTTLAVPFLTELLIPFGATVHPTPALAVAQADFVITMLDHGGIVSHVLFELGAADAIKQGTLLVDMSSIKPVEARDHAARLSERGVDYLDAPVSGGQAGAENGQLSVMAGGDAAAGRRCGASRCRRRRRIWRSMATA